MSQKNLLQQLQQSAATSSTHVTAPVHAVATVLALPEVLMPPHPLWPSFQGFCHTCDFADHRPQLGKELPIPSIWIPPLCCSEAMAGQFITSNQPPEGRSKDCSDCCNLGWVAPAALLCADSELGAFRFRAWSSQSQQGESSCSCSRMGEHVIVTAAPGAPSPAALWVPAPRVGRWLARGC